MVSASKLYERLLASRSTLRFGDFQRLLEAFGFALARTKGSHLIYKHPMVPRPFPVQPRGHEAKIYQVEEFLDMIDEYRLRIDK